MDGRWRAHILDLNTDIYDDRRFQLHSSYLASHISRRASHITHLLNCIIVYLYLEKYTKMILRVRLSNELVGLQLLLRFM